jgi:HlyD family secretion protein
MQKSCIMTGMDKPIENKYRWVKRSLWIGIPSLVILLLILRIIFGDKSTRLNVETDKLTIEDVRHDVFQDYIAVIGTVEPIKTIYLDAIESGRVEEIIIEEGSMLKKGDAILTLSNNNLLLEISNNEAQVARSVSELRSTRTLMYQALLNSKSQIIDLQKAVRQQERTYRYNKELIAANHISKEDFDRSLEEFEASKEKLKLYLESYKQDSLTRSIQVNSLEVSVDRMEKQMNLVRKRLENLAIKAPVNGELATLNVEVGEVVNYGTRIGTVNILDSYKMKVEIDEHYIARVIKKLVGQCDFSDRDYRAVITKIYPEVKNGRFSVDMVFTDTIPREIRIGQTSRIKLELGESQQAILIARGGFYQSTGGQWVYVMDESNNIATKRNIRIGRQNPRYYEVLEGLKPGEKVIVSSYDNFGDADILILKK